MASRVWAPTEAATILKEQGYAGHSSKLATEAKGALTACRTGDVQQAAAFLFRGCVADIRALLIIVYIMYRSGIRLVGAVKKRMQALTAWQHPFLTLGGRKYAVEHALHGSYLHFPVKGRGDGVARVCQQLLELKPFRQRGRMEQVGTLVFLIYMRSLRLAKFFLAEAKG